MVENDEELTAPRRWSRPARGNQVGVRHAGEGGRRLRNRQECRPVGRTLAPGPDHVPKSAIFEVSARPGIAVRVAAALVLVVTTASAQQAAQERYFYQGRRYGSESLYGPVYVFLNRAYDVLQLRAGNRNIFEQPYAQNAENVGYSLLHPIPAITDNGWSRFTREEVLPLSYTSDTARWVPNYTLHLLGGGMTYAMLREWFEYHHVPLAPLWSAMTVLGAAFVNETIENKGVRGWNTDAIADVYVFDIGGMLLFSFESVNRFFRTDILMADWSLQPSFTFPGGQLHNVGNNFVFKWPLPFEPRVRALFYSGLGMLGGLSYKWGETSISVAAGTRSYRLRNAAVENVRNVVEFAPAAGVFFDRNDSLLASVQWANVDDYFVQLNVYPNAFFTIDPGIGVWTVVSRSGQVIAGVTFTRALGFGVGAGTL